MEKAKKPFKGQFEYGLSFYPIALDSLETAPDLKDITVGPECDALKMWTKKYCNHVLFATGMRIDAKTTEVYGNGFTLTYHN